jgi:hypothetical protein
MRDNRTNTDKRTDVIVQLLERLAELTDPVRAGNGDGRNGMLLMPPTYTPSVKELERLLGRLRVEHHSVWWHVNERYLRSYTVTMWKCPKCKGLTHAATHRHRDRRGKHADYHGTRVLVVRYSPRVDEDKVKRGVVWLAENWGLVHEPMLPRELMVA